jgi:hypothetical protein
LDLVLATVFAEQTGRVLGACLPRPSDEVQPVWILEQARRFLASVSFTRRRHATLRIAKLIAP